MRNVKLKTIALVKALRGAIALGLSYKLFFMWMGSGEGCISLSSQFKAWGRQSPFLEFIGDWLNCIASEQILALTLLALCICVLRWVEGVGIWHNKSWAEALAIVSGSVYVAFEIWSLTKDYSHLIMVILLVNCLIVLYLGWVLLQKRFPVKT